MRVRLGGSRQTHGAGHGAGSGTGTGTGQGARPAPGLRLPAAYDLLDVPAAAGHRVLLQLERLGTPLGPVLTVQASGAGHEAGGAGGRVRFFVEAGTTASFLADLKDIGWDPGETDIRTIGVVLASETPLPPAGSARWVRAPEVVADAGTAADAGMTGRVLGERGQGEWVLGGERVLGERPVALPPARLLLGALAYACRRAEMRRGYALFAGSRSD